MFKLIALVLGLAVGFGGGVWYSSKHPEWAKSVGDQEEKYALQKSLEIAKATKSKLDQLAASGKTPGGASSFLGGGPSKGPDPEITELSQEQDANIAELEKMVAKAK